MFRAALVTAETDAPSFPNGNILDKHKIDLLYYIARNPRVDADWRSKVRGTRTPQGRRVEFGLMRDPVWDGYPFPRMLARMGHEDLNRVGCPSTQTCPYLWNIELDNSDYILQTFQAWRKLRWARDTRWALQYHKGGVISDALVTWVNADINMQLVFELYLGSPRMYPCAEGPGLKDLQDRGIQSKRIFGFYDGEKPLPEGWEGIVFNFDALVAQG